MTIAKVVLAAALLTLPASGSAGQGAPERQPIPVSTAQRDSARAWVDSLRSEYGSISISLDRLAAGHVVVGPGERVDGDVVAYRGNVDVHGTVDGHVVALFGDVALHPGSRVTGDAIGVGGRARLEGGTIDGEIRNIEGAVFAPARADRALTPAQATARNVGLAVGWFLMLGVIGIGLVLFAREKLERIADTVRDDFTRAFMVGILGQLALGPAIVLSIIGLAITIIGLLLIPFAVVALLLGAAGALALGFLAISYVAGETFQGRRAWSAGTSAYALRALLLGLAFYFGLWLVAALFTWAGFLGGLMRLLAAALTWVAVTVGFGATLISRGGTRAVGMTQQLEAPAPDDEVSWQTPTPVSGVAAARRPTPAPRPREP